VSANVQAWEHVKVWLDDNLNSLFGRLPVSTRNAYPDFPDFDTPTRLHAHHQAVPFRSNEANDAYVQLINNTILGLDTVKLPTHALAPAWKSTLCLVYTLDNMQAFPSLANTPDLPQPPLH
jgi:hypothetical protein